MAAIAKDAGLTPGRSIHVALKTLTPNFKRYEVRMDSGEWQATTEDFVWPLRPGSNRLEAKTVNQFGMIGPVSTAEIEAK